MRVLPWRVSESTGRSCKLAYADAHVRHPDRARGLRGEVLRKLWRVVTEANVMADETGAVRATLSQRAGISLVEVSA